MLVERLAGQPLHLLANVAAEDAAESAADGADSAGDRALGLKCAGERRGDGQPIRTPGDR